MIQATQEDLGAWKLEVGNETPNSAQTGELLYWAALLVAEYLQKCVWNPNNENHVEAIKKAQCAQTVGWETTEINPMLEGFTTNIHNVQSASLLGGSYTNSGAGVTGRNRANMADQLFPIPKRILTQAGITIAQPEVFG